MTGGQGQLGRELARLGEGTGGLFPGAPGGFHIAALGRAVLDVTDPRAIEAALDYFRPQAVIHAAALTDVDRCESEPQVALEVNAEATARLARACARRGIPLVYISTDYVFDGARAVPYAPGDAPNPLSVYGQSKLLGEQAVRAAGGPHAIVRTAWLYSVLGRNFPKAVLQAAAGGRSVRVVVDQVGSPTYARDLAGALLEMVRRGLDRSGLTLHAANEGACSRYELARHLLGLAGWDLPVEPITTGEMPRPARRPAYSALDPHDLNRAGIRLRHWRQALADFVCELGRVEPALLGPRAQPGV